MIFAGTISNESFLDSFTKNEENTTAVLDSNKYKGATTETLWTIM